MPTHIESVTASRLQLDRMLRQARVVKFLEGAQRLTWVDQCTVSDQGFETVKEHRVMTELESVQGTAAFAEEVAKSTGPLDTLYIKDIFLLLCQQSQYLTLKFCLPASSVAFLLNIWVEIFCVKKKTFCVTFCQFST